jgi:hypothetical protein
MNKWLMREKCSAYKFLVGKFEGGRTLERLAQMGKSLRTALR